VCKCADLNKIIKLNSMRTLSRYFLTLVFSLIFTTLIGQDIYYTISGEINDQKVGIDSILFENLENDTRFLIDNLSEQSDYEVNLTTQTLSGATSINDFAFENGFSLLSNTNGRLSIGCDFSIKEPVNISIYNIQGQKVYASSPLQLINQNSIHIKLAKTGIYLVKIESVLSVVTFKAVGSNNIHEFGVNINYQMLLQNAGSKSSLRTYDSDFSFEIGDRLKVSGYKNGYWATSNINQVFSSIPITFVYALSTFFTDPRDDQIYVTIEIGNQVWMAENLKYLPSVVGPNSESYTIPCYYAYGYNGTDVATAKASSNYTYGVLYNWPAAMNSAISSDSNPSSVQGACPCGWHIPSDSEWKELADYLLINGYGCGGSGSDIAKSIASISGWSTSPDPDDIGFDPITNNSSGFNAFPGGSRNGFGLFEGLGCTGSWWSSSVYSGSYPVYRYLLYNTELVYRSHTLKEVGLSVRCIKD